VCSGEGTSVEEDLEGDLGQSSCYTMVAGACCFDRFYTIGISGGRRNAGGGGEQA
jgi:hypothetical protein